MTPPVTSDGLPPAKRPRTTSPVPLPISTSPSFEHFLPPKFLLHLKAISSGTWKEGYYYEGKLSPPTPEAEESSEVLRLKLSSAKSALLVELRGDWVTELKKDLRELKGKRIACLCRGGKMEGSGEGLRMVFYEEGFQGWNVEDKSQFCFGTLRRKEDLSLALSAVPTSEAVGEANDINMAEVPRKWGLITPKNGNDPARTYLPLSEAFDPTAKKLGYFIAVATFSKEPANIKNGVGRNFFLSVFLKDPTVSEGVCVTLFAATEKELRRFQSGSILILQRLNLNTDAHNYTGMTGKYNLSSFNPTDLLEDKITLAKSKVVGAAVFGQRELEYAKEIAKWWETSAKNMSVTGESKRRLVPLKDLEKGKFYDVVGEVVRESYDTTSKNPKRIIYVSDYTTNERFFDYVPNTPHWSGPLGQQSIQITVAEPYPEMKKGDIVSIRNMRTKPALDLLEGGTWTQEGENKRRTDIQVLDLLANHYQELQPRLDIFIRRRINYWRKVDGRQAVGRSYKIFGRVEAAADKQKALASKPPITCSLSRDVVPIDDSRLRNVEARRHRGVIVDFWPRRLQEWIEVFCSSCDRPVENGKEFCDVHLKGALRFSFSLALDEAAGIAKKSEKYGFVVVKVVGEEAPSVLNGLLPTESIRTGGQDLDILTARMTPYLNKLLTCRLGVEESFRDDAGMEFQFGLIRKGDGQDAIYSFVDTKFV